MLTAIQPYAGWQYFIFCRINNIASVNLPALFVGTAVKFIWFHKKGFGKVYREEVFLTKAEAEKKLKELQNER